jgi:hypothetical protein
VDQIKQQLSTDPSLTSIIPSIIIFIKDKTQNLDEQALGAPNVQDFIIEILRLCIMNPDYKIEAFDKIFFIL